MCNYNHADYANKYLRANKRQIMI